MTRLRREPAASGWGEALEARRGWGERGWIELTQKSRGRRGRPRLWMLPRLDSNQQPSD